MLSIYVLPSEPGMPPQAILGDADEDSTTITGVLAIWSADLGAWTVEGESLPSEIGDTITDHAKSLGVKW